MAEGLKTCPFCGGEPTIWHTPTLGSGFYGRENPEPYSIRCCVITRDYESKEKITEFWNRRIDSD